MSRFAPEFDPAGRGPAWLYVLPCALEDLAKLGFSRDPLARMQALHPRWYEFFDLDRAFALQTERVRDARALELRLRRALVEHNAPAPLTALRAAGSTEWYRGALSALEATAQQLQRDGYQLQRPLRPWIRARLQVSGDLLHDWTALLSADELDARGCDARASLAQRRVIDVLDGYRALDLDPGPWLAASVREWYAAASA